ncbi:helix-turn-helix transcriptional regulator [Glaciibacter superstes]|uniref:helix-turn-helix transcriptional regulator n=1 Tax=Glaciibacter superstes TaxID=501023 RepID=UPI0003B68C39|nr:helix-turn-helix domain-containing protein [Glaciibacter superstes]
MRGQGDDDGQGDGGGRHAALASGVRRHVLDALAESGTPLDAAAIAAQLKLHVTTARFHLGQLEAAGLIRRRLERAGARGRPRVLFEAAPSARAENAQRELSGALASALAQDADGGRERAIQAGEQWSSEYSAEVAAEVAASAGSAGSGSGPLVRILDRLGFDPETRPDGRTIDLRSCPFRDEARQNPSVVCSVHLGLIRGVVEALGQDADDSGLAPFVEPELCVVSLRGGLARASAASR